MTKIENLLSSKALHCISKRGTVKLKGGGAENRTKNNDKDSVEENNNGKACPPPWIE